MAKKGFFFLLLLALTTTLFFSLDPDVKDSIPIDFFPNPLEPLTRVSVQGNEFKCLVDLGCGPEIMLKEGALNQIHQKDELEPASFSDIKGNIYPSVRFMLPDLTIGNIQFSKLEALKDHDEFHFYSQLGSTADSTVKRNMAKARIDRMDGKIGWRAFTSFDCFIDFPNSRLKLLKKGSAEKSLNSKKFNIVPFTLDRFGISILLETESGAYRVLLDTGSTFSFMKSSLVDQMRIQKMSIGGCDYGSWEFDFVDISDELKVDGCLGVDFFLEYTVYLDFQNNLAYIQKPERFFLTTQWKRFKHRLTQLYRRHFNIVV